MKTCRAYLSLLMVPAFIAPVQAQAPCGTRAEIVKMLTDKYREKPRAIAIANQSSLLEVFTSKSGSWTILITQPKGSSCIVGAGQSWEDIAAQKELTGL